MTNYQITVPIHQSRYKAIGYALIDNVISKYCIPGNIIMYQGSAFVSSLMNYLIKKSDIKIRVSGTFKDYYILLNEGYSSFFQYNSGGVLYIMSPLTSQIRKFSRKVAGKYIGLLVIDKIIDPYNYLLMTLDYKISCGLFKHEMLKPCFMRISQGNVFN